MLNLNLDNVPANTVCNMLIQNTSLDTSYYGGVRQKGSVLERKIKLAPKSSSPMPVTADKNSEIETYAEDDRYIKFTLTGHF